MGLRCSVLGHDYGETGVERERDERGEEVVRTAKRVRTCRRCDHERTVTENTEITALEPKAGVVRDGDGRVVAATAAENVATDGTGTITIEDDLAAGEIGDPAVDDPDDATADGTVKDAGTVGTVENGENTDESDSPDEISTRGDEGVATVGDDVRGRAPGEWPTPPNEGAATRPGGGSGARSLTPVDDATNATNPASEPKPLSKEWSVEVDGTSGDAATDAEADDPAGTEPAAETFACRSCGFTAAIADSPLRAGDICPECRAGYLARGTRKG